MGTFFRSWGGVGWGGGRGEHDTSTQRTCAQRFGTSRPRRPGGDRRHSASCARPRPRHPSIGLVSWPRAGNDAPAHVQRHARCVRSRTFFRPLVGSRWRDPLGPRHGLVEELGPPRCTLQRCSPYPSGRQRRVIVRGACTDIDRACGCARARTTRRRDNGAKEVLVGLAVAAANGREEDVVWRRDDIDKCNSVVLVDARWPRRSARMHVRAAHEWGRGCTAGLRQPQRSPPCLDRRTQLNHGALEGQALRARRKVAALKQRRELLLRGPQRKEVAEPA